MPSEGRESGASEIRRSRWVWVAMEVDMLDSRDTPLRVDEFRRAVRRVGRVPHAPLRSALQRLGARRRGLIGGCATPFFLLAGAGTLGP